MDTKIWQSWIEVLSNYIKLHVWLGEKGHIGFTSISCFETLSPRPNRTCRKVVQWYTLKVVYMYRQFDASYQLVTLDFRHDLVSKFDWFGSLGNCDLEMHMKLIGWKSMFMYIVLEHHVPTRLPKLKSIEHWLWNSTSILRVLLKQYRSLPTQTNWNREPLTSVTNKGQ